MNVGGVGAGKVCPAIGSRVGSWSPQDASSEEKVEVLTVGRSPGPVDVSATVGIGGEWAS
jgi:hypothetical protein